MNIININLSQIKMQIINWYMNNFDNKILIPAFLFKANQIKDCHINANNYVVI